MTEPGLSTVEYLVPPEDSSFPEEWYELGDADHFWFRWRLAALLAEARDLGLPADAPLRVLDVGAGRGVLREQLEARTAWRIDVADLNAAALQGARPGRGRILCYDVTRPDPSLCAAYDVVLLFDVLEHIPETGPFLAGVLRHLKPGGHLLVNVPALSFLFSWYDVTAGHVRRYQKPTLAAELGGTGLVVRDVRYWGLSLVPLLALRKWMVRGRGSAGERVRKGFEPPGRAAHAVLRTLQRVETALLSRPPLGTSLLLAAQVPGS